MNGRSGSFRRSNFCEKLKKAAKMTGIMVLVLGLISGCTLAESAADGSADGSADSEDEVSAETSAKAVTEATIETEADTYVDETNAVQIVLSQDGTMASGSGVSVSENVITITTGGSYQITGSLTDGQICVNADGDDTVVLMLAGVEIANSEDAAIYVENAGLTVLYLVEDAENRIVSGADTGDSAADGEADDTAEGGAIWAKDDLLIGGSGELSVSGFINNGIQTSNNLTIESGTIAVDAVNNGIKGKDSVMITGGAISVTSGGDGIKSDDTTGEGYGVITIADGEIQIESGCDGIQAETVLTISGGNIQITAGGGSGDTAVASSDGWGFNGFYEGWDMEDEAEDSTKGIKAGTELSVAGGTISVDSYDDSLHSNGTIVISGGSIEASTGDDGVHADTELTVTDGSITVAQSVEGLEANQITIAGGEISVTASDDGINANGGSNNWGMGMGSMGNASDSDTGSEMPCLLITGGTLWISAQGDGLDSNGDLTIEGGTIVVDGPSDSSNGAIDSGSENGGVCTVSGGTVLAIGASGMAETFSSSSEQYSFLLTLSSNYAAGSIITICDADGNVLFEHSSERSFSSIVFSSPELEEGAAYQITVDGDTTEITLSSVSGSYSQSGGSSEMNGYGGSGSFGGRTGGGRGGI